MKKSVFVLLVVLVFALSACQPAATPEASERIETTGGFYQNISTDGLQRMMDDKDFLFVNVHIPYEGDIPGTDLSIPYDHITEPAYLSQLPSNKDDKIVLYCRSDRMSTIAAEELVKLGYTDVWNLEGGMVEWERAGYPLEGN